jgi:hypothetical protein
VMDFEVRKLWPGYFHENPPDRRTYHGMPQVAEDTSAAFRFFPASWLVRETPRTFVKAWSAVIG